MNDGELQATLATKSATNYETQFGVSLVKRTRVDIEASLLLMVDAPIVKQSALDRTSALIAQAQKNLNLNEGEFTMWLADLPNNTTNPPAIYLASGAIQNQATGNPHKVGVCRAINSDVELYPAIDAGSYVYKYMNKEFSINPDGTERTDITESIVEQPKHGRIILDYVDENGYTHPSYRYVPDVGFGEFGNFVMEAKTSDITVQIYYTMSVGLPGEPNFTHDESTGDRIDDVSRCPNGQSWKISQLTSPQITFRDLTGAALGETVGEGANATITLDSDAAGHGWYEGGMFSFGGFSLDTGFNNSLSPTLSQGARGLNDLSNWLPTSNPNEWVARVGTAAEGKMDMLSVLLHEYGHALGIEHSSDAHDYMATTLTPGMRRLPSADAMQLMAQLAGEARDAIMAGNGYTLTVANNNTDSPTPSPTLPISMGFGISFLGLLRRNSSTSSIFANAATAPAQYNIAANATLTNGNFAITPTPTLPLEGGGSIAGWETTGKVNANNGAAVLSEVSTSQTRLNQVFVFGA